MTGTPSSPAPVSAAVSNTGHKVFSLERHQTLAGLTHGFSRDGFILDTWSGNPEPPESIRQ